MSEKTVVMKLWLSDDDYYEATLAIVRLTPEVAQEVLGRIELEHRDEGRRWLAELLGRDVPARANWTRANRYTAIA